MSTDESRFFIGALQRELLEKRHSRLISLNLQEAISDTGGYKVLLNTLHIRISRSKAHREENFDTSARESLYVLWSMKT